MKWRNTAFQYQGIAELCRKELAEAGIKVDKIFLNNGRYYVPWMPMNKPEHEIGVQIIWEHIWQNLK